MPSAPSVGPDVYFPIEIMTREYAGHVVLGTELASRGRVVTIGHKGAVAKTMKAADLANRPGLLFYKLDEIPKWAPPNHALVGMHPEAGIVYRDFGDFQRTTGIVSRRAPSKAQFCFGPRDHEWLSNQFPELKQRFRLTGSPRTQLWGPDGDIFYADDIERIRERYGDFVLFTSSGGFEHERTLEARGLDPEEAWAEADHAYHFFRMARMVAQSGIEVVIRPHPADSWMAWQLATNEAPGMHLDSRFDLAAWTRVARAIVHPGTSTAAFEAICADTPAISTGSHRETNVATDLSHIANDAEGLIQLLREATLSGLPTFPNTEARSSLENKLLHPLEGAAVRVADELDDAVPFHGESGVPLRRRGASPRLPRFLRVNRLRSAPAAQTARPFKRDLLALEIVERDVAASLKILGRTDDVRVRELDENCFALSL